MAGLLAAEVAITPDHLLHDIPVSNLCPHQIDAETAEVFFEAFARTAQANLHVVLHHGRNSHHISEAIFKSLARSLRMAVELLETAADIEGARG